ncbi:MAG: carboxypeptidase-like regulatory domain-containing protein [Candidatus Omnitrophica bacterium]|nr:carboxypeptidase-like regulatory domain-containing protein [Candidatus Omnitrophota bacterium]
MFKKIIIVLFFLYILINSLKVSSQGTDSIIQSGYSTKCLEASTSDAEWYDGWCNGCPHNINDPSTFDDTICVYDTGEVNGDGQPIHQCKLTYPPSDGVAHFILTNNPNNRFPPRVQIIPVIYINRKYTTTNNQLDQGLGLSYPNPPVKLSFPSNPSGIFYSDQNGNVRIEGVMTGQLQDHHDYQFYALYPPTLTENQIGTDQITGNSSSQQIGTFAFNTFNFEESTNKQVCTSIWWDPYGRIIDSQSLEPISNVKVRILDQINPKEQLADVITGSEVITKEDGIFNFLTKPGIYYLRLDNIPKTHVFSKNPNINKKYNLIYDEYVNSKKIIYLPDEPIKEIIDTPEESSRRRPDPEQRNILLDPGTNKPITSPIIHMELNQIVDGDNILFRGRASHPYPVLTIKDQKGNIILNKTEFLDNKARNGFWLLRIKRSQIPQDTTLIPLLSKNSKFFSTEDNINIIDSNYPRFEPILSYIEGYAKDINNNIIPNAKVEVKIYNSNKIFFKTTADKYGFFKINSKNLPPFPYYLTFNGNPKTTSQFFNDNKTYLESKNINLMLRNNNVKNIQETDNNLKNQIINKNNIDYKNIYQNPKSNILFNKQLFTIIVFIITLIILVFIIIFLYIKKQKK